LHFRFKFWEDYDNIKDVKKELNKFLILYLRKELKIRTPFNAVQSWFQVKPKIFEILPDIFQNIAFEMVQHGETLQIIFQIKEY